MVDTLVLRGSTALTVGSTDRTPSAGRPAGHLTVVEARGGSTDVVAAGRAVGGLILTRRGRLLLVGLPVALGMALLIVLGAFLTSKAQASDGPAQTSPTLTVTVSAGETLWGLASEHAPDRDPRDVVAEMVELNNLGSSVVQAGQSISVPAQN